MDLELTPGTSCTLVLLQENETDVDIISLLETIGLQQYLLTWKVSTEEGEVFSYRAEVLPTQQVELLQKHPTGFLYIPEDQIILHPNQRDQLWTRYCSLAQQLRKQDLEVRTFFEYQGGKTELQTPTPFAPDYRLYVPPQITTEQTLERITQAL
jgi:hypothetical protein